MKMTIKNILILLLILTAIPLMYAGQYDIPEGLYMVDIPDEELNTINNLYPEYGGLDPSFVENATDPNLHFTETGDVSVSYIDEGAGYKNKFGYFTYDDNNNILESHTLFENASGLGKGGILEAGHTLDLGTFEAGENVGFWLQANGYYNPDGNIYYTIDELNPDGLRHVAIAKIGEGEDQYLSIGIEDLYNLGDQDYNDIIFKLNVTPTTAINTESIPGNPAPPPLVTALISLFAFGIVILKRKIRK
ncbi:MAG: DUF4114 domain-containing protein [bacterium]|nr:DUF4114 domain-containing protein [bacterium]